jgi:hypothetical protein
VGLAFIVLESSSIYITGPRTIEEDKREVQMSKVQGMCVTPLFGGVPTLADLVRTSYRDKSHKVTL